VISRCRVASSLAFLSIALTLTGCSDAWNFGPLQYVENDALTQDLKGKANLAGKPALQDAVRKVLAKKFGEAPNRIRVPEGSGLVAGGLLLGNFVQEGEGKDAKLFPIYQAASFQAPSKVVVADHTDLRRQDGGYAVYRRNCLHCHGVSGAGDGPTAPFLYPPPRDYRRGIFKFTSTPYMQPPNRDDLKRTITNGLHGTSMPAFSSLLTNNEIEQVIDYVTFLAMRGESELNLIDAASGATDNDPNPLPDDVVNEVIGQVFAKWKLAQGQVVNPPIARTPSSPASIHRGRDLFLQSDCKDCHGVLGMGDGTSFVSQEVFNDVVFGGNPSELKARVNALDEKIKEMWNQKPDEWGNPLRPANLNRGIYKGGRRPLDLYWRIAKGINGAQMPGHFPALKEGQIWDVVNFVLALPYEPELLTDAPPTPTPPGPSVAAAAERR
jgi:mono/diheme cytochrome c family protein